MIPLGRVLVTVSIFLLVSLFVLGTATVFFSVFLLWRNRRRAKTKERVKRQIFERLGESDEEEWVEWCEGLSRAERGATKRLLADYLRQVKGRERTELQRVGKALGIEDRAVKRLGSRSKYARIGGLTWLTLLGGHASTYEVVKAATDRETRAVAGRYLYERGNDRTATHVVLDTGSPMSVFGMDTLYRANRSDSKPIHGWAMGESENWETELLIQVLTVVRHTEVTVDAESLGWIYPLIGHPNPDVRAAAVRALDSVGWMDSVRETVEMESLAEDESPDVRRATYETLSEWGDEVSLLLLAYRVTVEENDRCRLVAVESLHEKGYESKDVSHHEYHRTWDWVEARSEVTSS